LLLSRNADGAHHAKHCVGRVVLVHEGVGPGGQCGLFSMRPTTEHDSSRLAWQLAYHAEQMGSHMLRQSPIDDNDVRRYDRKLCDKVRLGANRADTLDVGLARQQESECRTYVR